MTAVTLIEIPQWGNVTLIEAIWLASGVLGMLVSLLRMSPLRRDYLNARAIGDQFLRVLARSYLRRESIRIAASGAIISIGVKVCWDPPPVPGPANVSIVGLWLTATLLAVALSFSVQSILDWRDRKELRRILGEPR